MFVKQIDLAEALKLAAKGCEVKVMAPNTPEPEKWTDYETDTIQHMLGGCLFFRSEPAAVNEEFEAAVQEAVSAPHCGSDGAAAESSKGATKPSAKCMGTGTKRKQVDTGKLLALRKAGWSMKKIGEELGISEGSVFNYLKKMEEK